MKIKTIKFLILILFIFSYLFIKPLNIFFSKELNFSSISYVFGKSFYDDIEVNNEYTEVIDYYIENNYLYVFPIEGMIKLPFGVSICKISSDFIEVLDIDTKYTIYKIEKRNKALYQYVYSNEVIGYTDDYFIIETNNIDYITSKLIINYEAI